MFSLLEGDGVIENIFHLLWTKDSIFGRESYVMIPDTIIFKYQKPCYWYFTSKQSNKIKKKTTSKLTNELIKEKFLENVSKSGIVAYFLYRKSVSKISTNPGNKTNLNSNEKEELNSNFSVEYFDKYNFEKFFDNLYSYSDGILQKFEDPKGDFNFTLRLIWSPKICLFEKRTNLKNLYNSKYSIYEKVVTYDGEEFQSRNEPLMGNNLPDRLEKIGNSIANHISNVTLERIKIARMILNFKITSNDTIILLWCSSLRLENSMDKKYSTANYNKQVENYKECKVNKIKINLSENVNMFKFSFNGKPIKPLKDSVCTSCHKKTESYRLSEISFKNIVESHDNKKREKENIINDENYHSLTSVVEIIPYLENKHQNQSIENHERMESKIQIIGNVLIPPIISFLYPRMKYDDYYKLKNQNVFASKTTYVCEECYIEITKFCNLFGTNTQSLIKKFKPFTGNVYSIKKKKEINKIFSNSDALSRIVSRTPSNYLNGLNRNKEKTNEKISSKTITNQMFCTKTEPDIVFPEIISNKRTLKQKLLDNKSHFLTISNLETEETRGKNLLDSIQIVDK